MTKNYFISNYKQYSSKLFLYKKEPPHRMFKVLLKGYKYIRIYHGMNTTNLWLTPNVAFSIVNDNEIILQNISKKSKLEVAIYSYIT